MKKSILSFVFFLPLCFLLNLNQTFAQFSNDVDGQLIINDLSGSVNYNYPISKNSIDGFPLSVNLSYVDNVLQTSLKSRLLS